MKRDLVAVVLAGGEGKRFWPLTMDKNLFPFLGKTFFDQSVVGALPKEVSRVVIVANESNAPFFHAYKFSVPHDVVIQRSAQGMDKAILTASAHLQSVSLLVVIADDLTEKHMLQSVVDKAYSSGAFSVLPGWKTSRYFPGGYLITEGERVKGITEKPGEGNEPSPYVYISGQYFRESESLLEALKQASSDRDDVYEQALTTLMKKESFIMTPYLGQFASLKYPWNILDSMDILFERLQKKQGKNVEIRSNIVVEGNVVFGDNVKVFENTKIVGPCYIGTNTIIGNNNIIRHSHIGSNCVTGFNTDITRSYIGDNSWFHSNYVGDSVLEGNVSLGSGAVLANLRLDEGEIHTTIKGERVNTRRTKLGAIIGKNVRIGVNASIMPGVKIGNGSFIGAGVTLDKDLPDNQICFVRQQHTVTTNTRSVMESTTREQFREKV